MQASALSYPHVRPERGMFRVSTGTTTSTIPNSIENSRISSMDSQMDSAYSFTGFDVDTEMNWKKLSRYITPTGDFVFFDPIQVREFSVEGEIHSFNAPLKLEPLYDPNSDFYSLIDDCLGIDIYAETISELRDELEYELAFLWKAYAQGNPKNMTSQAIQLRNNLLSAIS